MSAPGRTGGGAPGASQGEAPACPADLAHLFRHALRAGRIHPLMPLVLCYRQALATTAMASADPLPPADEEAP